MRVQVNISLLKSQVSTNKCQSVEDSLPNRITDQLGTLSVIAAVHC